MNKIQKKIIINTYRKQKEKLDRVHERNFQNSRNFLRNFQFAYCGSSDNPTAFIEKRETEKMAKVKFGQTRLRHVSESYTLLECANKPGYDSTFCME